MQNTNQKYCLVTGASSGLGKEIAIGLAKSKAHVIMVCRNETKSRKVLEEIQNITGSKKIDLIIADLSSQTEIKNLVKIINERYPRLDVLINNAGVVLYKKELSIDGIEMTLAVNHLSPFLLTSLLKDLLQKSHSSRVVNISSTSHKWVVPDLTDLQFENKKYQFMRAYAQSKFIMNVISFRLANEFLNSGITVNCIHPGAVKTSLGSNEKHGIILKLLDRFIKFFFISPKKAAQAVLNLALHQQYATVTGQYFEKNKIKKASPHCYNEKLAKDIWEVTCVSCQRRLA